MADSTASVIPATLKPLNSLTLVISANDDIDLRSIVRAVIVRSKFRRP